MKHLVFNMSVTVKTSGQWKYVCDIDFFWDDIFDIGHNLKELILTRGDKGARMVINFTGWMESFITVHVRTFLMTMAISKNDISKIKSEKKHPRLLSCTFFLPHQLWKFCTRMAGCTWISTQNFNFNFLKIK